MPLAAILRAGGARVAGSDRSLDAGLTWSVVPLPEGDGAIGHRGFVHAAGALFASTGNGLYQWNEADGEWQTAALALPEGLIALAGTAEALFAAGREQIYRWDDKKLLFERVATTYADGGASSVRSAS